MEDLVTVTLDGGVAEIYFNRPDSHNALSLDMFDAIAAAGERVHTDPAIRVVVLTGNGPSFCAGLDLELMRTMVGADDEAKAAMSSLLGRGDRPDNLAQRVAYTWKSAPVPVIAAIRGVAFGGGMQIALGCDMRVAAPDARLCIMEARYGLIPDMSISQTLPELIARDRALELTLTAREFDGREALELGLVTLLDDDPLAAAQQLAQTIAARSPEAVRAVKELYNTVWPADAERGLRLEEALQLPLIGSSNQVEAVQAAMARRAPRFSDPIR